LAPGSSHFLQLGLILPFQSCRPYAGSVLAGPWLHGGSACAQLIPTPLNSGVLAEVSMIY